MTTPAVPKPLVSAPNGPTTVLAIASVERTGSTLLCSVLRQTGVAGHPMEHLNIRSVNFDRFREEHHLPRIRASYLPMAALRRLSGRNSWRDLSSFSHRSWRRYLLETAAANTTPNGVFGIKMHWDQYHRHMLEMGLDVGLWRAPVRWVRMTRDDEVRQAVSFVRAAQTMSWNSNMTAVAEPVYDPSAIRTAIERITSENREWDRHLEGLGVEPLRITFEQLIADRERTVRGVLAHCGAETDVIPDPGTRPQSDAINDEWVARFAAEER